MSYRKMSLNKFVGKFIKDVKNTTLGGYSVDYCFVLGAGASKESGIPTGKELVDRWDEELKSDDSNAHEEWKKATGITAENKYQSYNKYYDRVFEGQSLEGYNFLINCMENVSPSIGYVMLAHLMKYTRNHVIITTNFDHLLEDAVSYYFHTMPFVVGHEAMAQQLTHRPNRPVIAKIHRDLMFFPKNGEKEVSELSESWEAPLSDIFSRYNPVFIGYAGNDKSLMNFLIKNSNKFKTGKWKRPYWMLYKDEDLDGKVKEFVDNADGYVICHDGFDSVLYLLGTALGFVAPTEDDFLKSHKDRFKALTDSINKFNEENAKRYVQVSTENRSSGATTPVKPAPDIKSTENSVAPSSDNSAEQTKYSSTAERSTRPRPSMSRRVRQRKYEESLELYRIGRSGEALQIMNELVKQDPSNAKYQFLLGEVHYYQKEIEEALFAYWNAISLDPNNTNYRRRLGGILYHLHLDKEALSVLQETDYLARDDVLYLRLFGNVLYRLGKYDEALPVLIRVVSLDHDNKNANELIRSILSKTR